PVGGSSISVAVAAPATATAPATTPVASASAAAAIAASAATAPAILARAGLVDRQVPAPEIPTVQGIGRVVGPTLHLDEGEALRAVRVAVDDDLGRGDL